MSVVSKKISVTQHEKNLRTLRCCVSRSPTPQLHHTHGGSMKEHGWHVGMGQKQNPFLQIPLKANYHVGDMGVDRIGVETWEEYFGTQWSHLEWVNEQLPYDLFREAELWERENRANTATRKPSMTGGSSTQSESGTDTSD
jgi:hypothetical protein